MLCFVPQLKAAAACRVVLSHFIPAFDRDDDWVCVFQRYVFSCNHRQHTCGPPHAFAPGLSCDVDLDVSPVDRTQTGVIVGSVVFFLF